MTLKQLLCLLGFFLLAVLLLPRQPKSALKSKTNLPKPEVTLNS